MITAQALLRYAEIARACDDADSRMSGFNEMGRTLFCSTKVVHRNRIAFEAFWHAVKKHYRCAFGGCAVDMLQIAIARDNQQKAIYAIPLEHIEKLLLPLQLAVGIERHQNIVVAERGIFGPSYKKRKKRIRDIGNDHADHLCSIAFQTARSVVRVVIQFFNDAEHPAPQLRANGVAAFSTFETVPTETPARTATSLIVLRAER